MAAPPCSVCGHKHFYDHVSQPDTPCWHIYDPSKEVCGHLVAKCLWCFCSVTQEDGHYKLTDGGFLHVICREQVESEAPRGELQLMNLPAAVVNTEFGEA